MEINTLQKKCSINGNDTDVVVSDYKNLLLIFITQFKKPGSTFLVKKETSLEETEGSVVFNVQTLFGEDDLLTSVVARTLGEHLIGSKPILFNLALKDKTAHFVKEMSEILIPCKNW